jgi:mono/diheme cytochrome c family protein
MKGFRLRRGSAVAACAVLAVAQGGCALPSTRPAPHAAAAAATARPAGGKIYDKWCSDCHSTPSGPGSLALQRRYAGAVPAVLEQRSNLPPDFVKLVVRRGMSFMPSFRKTEISDAELALVAAYLAPSP